MKRSYRDDGCEKYRKWKAERAKRLKKSSTVKKKKRKKPKIDCIDEVEVEVAAKPSLKFNYRKCRQKKKKKRKVTGRLIRKIYKHVSYADLVLGCIKPSIDVRQYILNPRHIDCLGLTAPSCIELPVAVEPQTNADNQRKSKKRRTPCAKAPKKSAFRKESDELDAENSECQSICSFDSEICLAGMKLTTKDKEEIKKHQREAREPKLHDLLLR